LEVIRNQLRRNDVATFDGTARFAGPHALEVETRGTTLMLGAKNFLIACGTRPARSDVVPVDGASILDSDQLRDARSLPREITVVGAGVIGLEYASMFSALGARVTVIDQRPRLLEFADEEIAEALCYRLRSRGTTFRLGERVVGAGADGRRVVTLLESGKRIESDALLYTVGRQPNSDRLRLDAAGVKTDDRGRICVNEHFQTGVPHIYAAGDIIGAPSLASASMEQGRVAACHMYGVPARMSRDLLPMGIYTIPEISMVGRSEQELTRARVPYAVGVARFHELARGQMLGNRTGLLKLLFAPDSLALLGVHVIGETATELIHIGQAVLSLGGTIEYFRETVFNYPTLAEAYKVAALDGLNKLHR